VSSRAITARRRPTRLPLVGVGLFYKQGYFDQRIRGRLEEDSEESLRTELIRSPRWPGAGGPLRRGRAYFGRPVYIRAWLLQVGRVRSTCLTPTSRRTTRTTGPVQAGYMAAARSSASAEWLLGTGGVRVLRALGIERRRGTPTRACRFMPLERCGNWSCGDAVRRGGQAVRSTSVFTTHTRARCHDTFDRRWWRMHGAGVGGAGVTGTRCWRWGATRPPTATAST